jgi:hypothetical protein
MNEPDSIVSMRSTTANADCKRPRKGTLLRQPIVHPAAAAAAAMSRQTMIPGPSTAMIDGDSRRMEFFSTRGSSADQPNQTEAELEAATGGAMNRMIDHLVERKAVLTKLFRTVDTDQSGGIDAHELGNALSVLGLKLSRQELRNIMNRLDTDGNGSIELSEFLMHFKKERSLRFEGHIPELKAAKMALVHRLRDDTAGLVAEKDGLYRTLTQIEALQRTGDLTAMEVTALRRKIGGMVKRGMVLKPHEARDLKRAAQRAAALPEPAVHPRVRRDVYGQIKSTGQYELPGPRMGPAQRTTRRLTSSERAERDLERREDYEILRMQRKTKQKRAAAANGRRKRAPTFNDEVAARNRSIAEMRARSTPPVLQQPLAPMEHVSGSAAQVGLTVTEPTRRQRGAKWVERDGKYIWQRVGAAPAGGEADVVQQGMQRDLVSKNVEERWIAAGTDMTRRGADMAGLPQRWGSGEGFSKEYYQEINAKEHAHNPSANVRNSSRAW